MNQSLPLRYAQFITSNKPIIVFLYVAIVFSSMAVVAQKLFSGESFVDNSISIWFNKDDPDLIEFNRFKINFGNQEWNSILVKTSDIYNKRFLEELKVVTAEIESLSIVFRATSIANVRANRVINDEELWFTTVFENNEDLTWGTSEKLAEFKDRLNKSGFAANLLYKNNDNQHALIVIQSEDRQDDPDDYRQEFYTSIYKILENRDTFEKVSFQGASPLNVALNQSSVRDVYIFYSSTVVLLGVIGLLIFGSIRDTIVLLVMSMGVTAPSMAGIIAVGLRYNMMSQILPVLMVAVATANVVHLIKEFHRNRVTLSNEEAIHKAISLLWVGGLWAALTTIVGFSSFVVSQVQPVSHFGSFGAFGVTLGFILSISVAPITLLYLYKDVAAPSFESAGPIDKFMKSLPIFLERKKYIVIGIFMFLAFSLIGIKDLSIKSNFSTFIGQSALTRSSFDYTREKGFPGAAAHLSLDYSEGTFASDENRFRKLVALEKGLEDLASKRSDFYVVLGPAKMLWEVDKAISGQSANYERFASYSEAELNDLIFTSELSGNDQLVDFLSTDKGKIRVALLVDFMDSQTLHQFRKEVNEIISSVGISDADIIFTSNLVLLSNMDAHVAETQFYSIMIVMAFLFIILPILFKSFLLGVLGLLFNMFPLLFIYSLMGWTNVSVDLATVVVGGVSLSLVVDDTIHLLVRFFQYRKMGFEWDKAVDEAVVTIGHSITLTSIILASIFGVMILSDFTPVRYFGFFIVLTVIVAWGMDLFLLPILLKGFKRFSGVVEEHAGEGGQIGGIAK